VRQPRSLTEVAASGLCSGCGLCAGMARGGTVKMVMTDEGFLRPHVAPNIDPAEHARLLGMCPGFHLEQLSTRAPYLNAHWGPYRRLAKAHAADPMLRHRGSSGGVISAITNFLLETSQVQFVLHVRADADAPLRSRIQTSRNLNELLEAAGARYGPAAPLARLGEMLAWDLPFAIVGKPCDIAGVRNLAARDPRVDRLVRYTIAFFCGGVSSLCISEQIVRKYGLEPQDVAALRYRGFGCPGATHIAAKDGRTFEQTYDETWSEELNQEIQFRCKICADSTGEHADIVCGDAWETLDGYAHVEHEGWNSVIARSAAGDQLLRAAEAAGVVVTKPLSIDALDRIQPHQVERKAQMLARLAGLRLSRQPVPRYRGLRLLRNAWADWRSFIPGMLGTYRRARAGANRENINARDPAGRAPPATRPS
jgi:coenzyme F420 hydrogenase subunit beta